MFVKYMYKHLHANGCNFVTHYTLHTSVEAVGCCTGSWLVFASCLGLTMNLKSLLGIKINIGSLKYLLSIYYVTDSFLEGGHTMVTKTETLPMGLL